MSGSNPAPFIRAFVSPLTLGVHHEETYLEKFKIIDMEVYQHELLEKWSYGLDRTYPRFYPNFDTDKMKELIGDFFVLNSDKTMILITVLNMNLLAGMEFDIFVPSFPELQTHFNLSSFSVEALLSANLMVQVPGF